VHYTIRWWRNEDKPVGIEYRWLGSPEAIEAEICELLDTVRVRLIEVRNGAGELVAHYPDPNIHRARPGPPRRVPLRGTCI